MHLWGAQQVIKSIKDKKVKKLIQDNLDYYYLGALVPDSFICIGKSEVSGYIHGDTKKNCDYFVKKMLKKKDDKNRAFVYGFITHCAFDGTWHPVINHFAGNYKKRHFAIYNHFLFETYLAIHYGVNKPWKFSKPKLIRNTNFKSLKIKSGWTALRFQNICLYLLDKKWSYELFFILSKLNIFPRKAISLFKHHLLRDHRHFRNGQEYKDLISGKVNKVSYKKLNKNAIDLAVSLIKSAHKTGTCKGFNLATGKKSKTIYDAKYFKS